MEKIEIGHAFIYDCLWYYEDINDKEPSSDFLSVYPNEEIEKLSNSLSYILVKNLKFSKEGKIKVDKKKEYQNIYEILFLVKAIKDRLINEYDDKFLIIDHLTSYYQNKLKEIDKENLKYLNRIHLNRLNNLGNSPYNKIAFPYAINFNEKRLEKEFDKHKIDTHSKNKETYIKKAIKFLNNIDRINNISFVDDKCITYKYSKLTNEFGIINYFGEIRSYLCPKEGIDYFYKLKKKLNINDDLIKGKIREDLLCPVCHSYHFVTYRDTDNLNNDYCRMCGYKFDINEIDDFNYREGRNKKSIYELIDEYHNKLRFNRNYVFYKRKK